MKSQSTPGQPDVLENCDGKSVPTVSTSVPISSKASAKGTTISRSLFWGFTFLIAATASATIGTTISLITPIPGAVAPAEGQKIFNDLWRSGFQYRVGRPVNILVMGIDKVPGVPDASNEIFSGRSDTMLLLRIDPSDNTVNLLSIPRDTQVEIPGIGVTKINQANASGGPALARQAVTNTLSGIEVDRYVRVSTNAFRELVDLLGGVDVYVPQPMSYVDNTQKLKIDLAQGWQTLNGDQAEQFARFRHDNFGDIGRVQRQQTLIKALRSKLASPLMLPRVPSLITLMQKYIDTNLSVEEMLALVNLGLKLDKNDFKMVMLPGRFSAPDEFAASYWLMDTQGRDRVLQDYFKVGSTDGSNATSAPIRIAVQNASSQPDVGKQVMSYLTDLGYKNVYLTQDWADHQDKTQIIVQKGDLRSANALQATIGFGEIEAASVGDLDSDLTIRVGDDWLAQQPVKP
ncbi:MAG: LCP family protein [Phormidesmis sp. CAN_BIN36]|nr:LCP family protein [Phormidesmis sp. CAN_BIN36]